MTFLKINYGMKGDAKKKLYEEIWLCVTKFLKLYQDSVNPNTYFWIIEIYTLLAEKFNIADIIEDVYNDYSRLLNSTLFNISKLASNQIGLSFFTTEERQKLVFPLPPTIFEMHKKYKGENAL